MTQSTCFAGHLPPSVQKWINAALTQFGNFFQLHRPKPVCLFFDTEINNLHYFVVTPLYVNGPILKKKGHNFSMFHHFSPFFDNKSHTLPHELLIVHASHCVLSDVACLSIIKITSLFHGSTGAKNQHSLGWYLTKTCFWYFDTCLSIKSHINYLTFCLLLKVHQLRLIAYWKDEAH